MPASVLRQFAAVRHWHRCLVPESSSTLSLLEHYTQTFVRTSLSACLSTATVCCCESLAPLSRSSREFFNSQSFLEHYTQTFVRTSLSACLSTATVCCCEALAPLSRSREFFNLSRSVNIMRSSPFSWQCTGNKDILHITGWAMMMSNFGPCQCHLSSL